MVQDSVEHCRREHTFANDKHAHPGDTRSHPGPLDHRPTADHSRSRVKAGQPSIGIDTDLSLVTNRTKGCAVRFLAVQGG